MILQRSLQVENIWSSTASASPPDITYSTPRTGTTRRVWSSDHRGSDTPSQESPCKTLRPWSRPNMVDQEGRQCYCTGDCPHARMCNHHSNKAMFFKNLKPSINEHLTNLWQNRWSQSFPNKFLEIVPDLKNWKVPLLQQTRKDEIIMCRSRLGHARLTHSYLFRNEDPPECIYCACRLTVKHIRIECPDFELSRQKYFNFNTLPELFEKHQEQISWVMTYLKEIGLYSRF